jgi:hypothetical protein
VRCFACGHRCKIPDGQPGVCRVRYNRGGTLFVIWRYVGGNTVLNAGFMLLNSMPIPSPPVECATVALHWKNSVSVRIFTRITVPLENGSGKAKYAPKMLKSLTLAGRTSDESIASAVATKGYLCYTTFWTPRGVHKSLIFDGGGTRRVPRQ